jgi:nucleotide-binding universal stress UspA family protein
MIGKEIHMNPTQLSSMIRPKVILVATNLHDLDFVLPVAMEQAKMTGALLWLLHVIPPDAYVSVESGDFPGVQKEKAFLDAEAILNGVAFRLKEQNLACAYEVRRWYPIDQIQEFISEHGVERLILGTSGRGKVGKLLVGSTAEELIRNVNIPVCTVGPHFRPLAQGTPRRIVFALSLRHHPEQGFQFAADLAAGLQAELTVLHVTEQDRFDEAAGAGALSKINEIVRLAEQPPHLHLRSGEPAEEILAECAALRPELLVLGSCAASTFSARFRNGVVYRVIAQAPCPTFTLRSGSKAKHDGNYREFSGAPQESSQPRGRI